MKPKSTREECVVSHGIRDERVKEKEAHWGWKRVKRIGHPNLISCSASSDLVSFDQLWSSLMVLFVFNKFVSKWTSQAKLSLSKTFFYISLRFGSQIPLREMRGRHGSWSSVYHGSGMRCGLGSLVHISELNSAIAFLSVKNAIALFSSEMCIPSFQVHISSQDHGHDMIVVHKLRNHL